MELMPTREQMLALPQLIWVCGRDVVGQQFVSRPDMISQACCHRRGHWAPCVEAPDGNRPAIPQLLLKPRQILGEAIRATGQVSITLALCEVITFDKARVHHLTDWRGRQVRRPVLLGTK